MRNVATSRRNPAKGKLILTTLRRQIVEGHWLPGDTRESLYRVGILHEEDEGGQQFLLLLPDPNTPDEEPIAE